MLSLKRAAAISRSFMLTEGPDITSAEVVFAYDRTTMEYAMGAGLSRNNLDQTTDLELENRP